MNATLSHEELLAMGFKACGEGVKISRKASIHGAARISLGHAVRIDDFCVLSAGAGGICLGSYIHVAVHSTIIGAGEVEVMDYANISSRVSIYSSSDDFSGHAMTNPTIPREFTNVVDAKVVIGRHVIIGAGCVVLPGITLEEGVAVGALSLVDGDCAAFGIYAGIPARRIKERARDLLQVERRLQAFLGSCAPGT